MFLKVYYKVTKRRDIVKINVVVCYSHYYITNKNNKACIILYL